MVISGTARGADREGEKWAEERGIEVLRLDAKWEQYGRRAGPIRNREMAQIAAGLVAIWDGKSPGTKDMVETARRLGLRVFVLRTDTLQSVNWPPSGELEKLWDAAEERASILEFGGSMSRAEAERLAGKLERGVPQLLAKSGGATTRGIAGPREHSALLDRLTDLSARDKARLFEDIQAKSGDVHAAQGGQWIREAHYYTQKIAAEGAAASPESRSLFWIRLSGLQEVRDRVEKQLKSFQEMMRDDPATEERLRPVYAEPARRLLESIDALWATLKDDELLYLLYRRDTECHPWQDSYRLRIGKEGLRDERTVFGRKWKIEELDNALGKVLRSYGVDEVALAVDFSRRVSPAMGQVLEASKDWFK